MYRYLNNKVADYSTTIFSVTPTKVLPQTGDKSQIAREFSDGKISVTGVSANNFFEVQLQWDYITDADHTTLFDFWHDSVKGDGRRRTFYWLHPIDNRVYTVRFITPLTSSYNTVGHLSVSQVTLRVEGRRGTVYDSAWDSYTETWDTYETNWA